MLRDVYELLSAKPHDPPHERLTDEQRRIYLLGYDYALIIAMRVLQAAVRNHESIAKLKRRVARAEAAKRREREARLRLLLTRGCAWWDSQRRHFCGAPAAWLTVDAEQRPLEFRCHIHRSPECHALPASMSGDDRGQLEWLLDWGTGEIRAMKQKP